jgi:hypothetical protein
VEKSKYVDKAAIIQEKKNKEKVEVRDDHSSAGVSSIADDSISNHSAHQQQSVSIHEFVDS